MHALRPLELLRVVLQEGVVVHCCVASGGGRVGDVRKVGSESSFERRECCTFVHMFG